jgi:hypothetical protein
MLVSTYLNDHLAGATAGRELARRAAGNNRGTALGRFLEQLAQEVDEDRDSLLALMSEMQITPDRVKVLAGWAAEKLGRLKPNGRLLSYSPLSRLVELEGLLLGARGKLALWTALQTLEGDQPVLARADLGALSRRAEDQLEQLEQHRLQAAAEALLAR